MGCTGSKTTEPSTQKKEAVNGTLLKDPEVEKKAGEPTEILASAPKSKFFAVYHTFKSADAAEAFWKMMSEIKPEDMVKMNADWEAKGFHNHLFLPEGGEKPTCCVWETKNEMTVAEFQDFIDSKDGPGGGATFKNRVTHATAAAATPSSFFEKSCGDQEATKVTTGAFFWVDHTFKSADAAASFWKFVSESKPEDMAKMNADWDAMGFHNHFFLPEGGAGQTICIWESKSDITAAEFKAFMDSEKAPGGGQTFDNEVHKVAPAGLTPSAFFTDQSQQEPAVADPKSNFFAVYHTFKSAELAESFWKFIAESKPEDTSKMNADWDAMGFHNHLFLPDGGDNPACCIWETKDEMTVGEFQAFIDSEKGPGGGKTFHNRVTHAAPGASTPPSFFEQSATSEAPKPSTGAFFWVDHTFKSADAAASFWKFVTESKPEDMAQMNADWDAMGFHNHFFLPEGGAGQTICIWESKSDMTSAEFKAFMDSEKAPGGGHTFDNEVHKVAPGGLTPSAFFTQPVQTPLEELAVPVTPVVVTAEATASSQRGWCLHYCSATEAQGEIVLEK